MLKNIVDGVRMHELLRHMWYNNNVHKGVADFCQ